MRLRHTNSNNYPCREEPTVIPPADLPLLLTQNISDASGHQMSEASSPHQAILLNASWVSYNLTQFGHGLPRESVRSHKLRAGSHETMPPDFRCQWHPLPLLMRTGSSPDHLISHHTGTYFTFLLRDSPNTLCFCSFSCFTGVIYQEVSQGTNY